MIERDYFSHTIPGFGKVFDKLDEKGYCYTLAGENIGWNTNPDGEATAAIHQMFMDSSGHRANILGDLGRHRRRRVQGPGDKKMWTVLFADTCCGAGPDADPQADAQADAKPTPKPTPKPDAKTGRDAQADRGADARTDARADTDADARHRRRRRRRRPTPTPTPDTDADEPTPTPTPTPTPEPTPTPTPEPPPIGLRVVEQRILAEPARHDRHRRDRLLLRSLILVPPSTGAQRTRAETARRRHARRRVHSAP